MMSETLLVKGNKVEVTSDEEGFKGAWYTAKIIKTPSKNQKGKALVEYESLLADDEKSLLKEYVDPSFIRPLPPEAKKLASFEVFDVVDAFYKDGWWKGVISEVKDFGEEDKKKPTRYTVIFDNPPDQIEFEPSILRFHLDWVGGSWVKPKKQKRMEGLKFSKGMAVVVNIDEGNLSNDWFEAVVLEEVGFNSFLVKLSNTKDESGLMKPTVDSFHIRPPFPKLESKIFQLLEKVYVLYRSGWRLGFITKVLSEGRFSVTLQHSKAEMEFCHSEIRPNMDFINGSWVHYCKETNEQRTGIEDETMISAEDEGMQPHVQVISQLDLTTGDGNDNTKGDSAKEIELEHVTEEVGLSILLATGMRGSDAENPYQEISLQEANDGKQRKRVTSREINIGEDELNNNLGEKHNIAGGGAINVDFENPTTKRVKLPTAHVEPVGMLVCQPETVERGNGMRDLQVEMITQYPEIDASVDGELAEHQLMPVVKNSPVWDMVESLEVFQRMPQKPHFNPLVNCKELEREGSAIGKMVQFATVVEKTSKLRVGDPRTVFDSYLETLADLKCYGFDVEAVVCRINGLLSIKESQVQLQSKSKEVESQIAESTCERTKLEEDIEAIDRKIRELEEERGLALSMKEKKDSEISNLRMQSSGISADIAKAILDFEILATASW